MGPAGVMAQMPSSQGSNFDLDLGHPLSAWALPPAATVSAVTDVAGLDRFDGDARTGSGEALSVRWATLVPTSATWLLLPLSTIDFSGLLPCYHA